MKNYYQTQQHQNNYTFETRMVYETPEIHFRPLPFYDVIDDLIRPAGLMSNGVIGQSHESIFEFKLSIEQADELAMSTTRQILLRFCHHDPSCEQEDNFPSDVVVQVNGANVILPPAISNPNKPNIPPKRPGQHVEITKLCKLCPFVSNVITVKWFVDQLEPSRSYVINVSIAEKLGSDILLNRIRERGVIDPEMTKKLVSDSDNEVSTMNLRSSLVCPLGKMRMSMPCKSISCQHIPCFDALFYLQMNEKKASWICPICYKPAYYRDLMIDGFYMDILQNTTQSVTEITLNLDGTWSPVVKSEQNHSSIENSAAYEVITISDDDDDQNSA